MGFQVGALLWCAVLGIHVALVICQRHLRIHHHVTIVWEMEDEVRDESLAVVALQSLATLVLQCLLGVKLLALLQFQVFQQLFQFQLTEVTLHLHFAS